IKKFQIFKTTICTIICHQNFYTYGCRGFCFEEPTTCKLYGIPNIGENSKTLKWISIKNLKVKMTSLEAYNECKNNGLFSPLPTRRATKAYSQEIKNIVATTTTFNS
ncbi:hypothetical protein Avbf_12611, partial [Armadillidium vulgare]